MLVLVAGPGCASGPPALAGQPIRKPIAVLVRVSAEAAKTDELGGTAGIVDAVERELASRGIRHQVFAGTTIALPRRESRSGCRDGMLGTGASVWERASSLALPGTWPLLEATSWCCGVYRNGEVTPALERSYAGSILGTDEDASLSEGESVGESIVDDALRKP